MNAETKVEGGGLQLLRQPFPTHQISKLPKPTKKDAPKGKCKPKSQGGDAPDWQDHFCGGYHGLPAAHLDYVGHAALTDRLLDADPEWTWEPMGTTPDGLPAINGGLWIKLTVCGVSRFGFGSADGKQGGDAVKEMIGDALRNAAMRFGAALDLWHKGDLHVEQHDPETGEIKTGEPTPKTRQKLDGPYPSPSALKGAIKTFAERLRTWNDDLAGFTAWMATPDVVELEKQAVRDAPELWESGDGMPAEFEPIVSRIERKRRELEELESINARNPIHAG